MPQITQNDWMDDIVGRLPPDTIGVNPLQTLKAIPWARHKLMLVTVVSSIVGLMAVYFTENRFIYALSVVGIAMFCSAMFVSLFGVEHKPKPEPIITPEQQKAYEERMGTLRAEYYFKKKMEV